MRVLVSGGSGFIGQHVVAELMRSGHEVCVLSRTPTNCNKIVPSISFDGLSNFSDLNCDAILHLATDYARAGDVEKAWEANYHLPMRLLALAEEFDVKIFINTDSFYTHAPQVFEHLADYISTKNAFKERLFNSNSPTLKKINLVLSHVVGSGDSNKKFVPWVLDQLIRNQEVMLTECEQELDFVDVDDIAKAFSLVVSNESYLPDKIEIEAGSGTVTRLRDLLELIYDGVKDQCDIDDGLLLFGSRKQGNVKGRFPADNKILGQLGWSCHVTLNQSISKMIEEKIK